MDRKIHEKGVAKNMKRKTAAKRFLLIALTLVLCCGGILPEVGVQTVRADEVASTVWFAYENGNIQTPDEKNAIILRPEDVGQFKTNASPGTVTWNCEERFLIIGTGWEDHKWIHPQTGAFQPCENVPTRGGVTAEILDKDGNVLYIFIIRIVDDKQLINAVLKTLIESAEKKAEEDYTADSFAKLQAVLAEAKRVCADTSAKQDEIDRAADALRQALDALVEKTVDSDKKDTTSAVPDKPSTPSVPAKPSTPSGSQTTMIQPVKQPFNAKAVSKAYNRVQISWNRQENISGYKVYRAESAKGKYKTVATVSASTLNWTDKKVTVGKTYYYKVCTYRKDGSQNTGQIYTGIVSAKPVPAAAAWEKVSVGSKKATVHWKKVSGASGYQLYRADSRQGKYKCIKTQKGTKYTNKKLKKGKTYYYKVRAYKTVGKKKLYGAFSAIKEVKVK